VLPPYHVKIVKDSYVVRVYLLLLMGGKFYVRHGYF
jgi:hypothetical protein